MTTSARMPYPVSCPTSFVGEVHVQRFLDISEQDAEAEGVRHFVEESHGVMSFEGLHGAGRAALVCFVYGSQRDAFRPVRETVIRPTNPSAPAGDMIIDTRVGLGGWMPGNFVRRCHQCDERFRGDGQAMTCADCAYATTGDDE